MTYKDKASYDSTPPCRLPPPCVRIEWRKPIGCLFMWYFLLYVRMFAVCVHCMWDSYSMRTCSFDTGIILYVWFSYGVRIINITWICARRIRMSCEYVHIYTLQQTATHCITHCNTRCNTHLQHTLLPAQWYRYTATHCNTNCNTATLQHTLQHTKYLSSMLSSVDTLQHTATHCNTLPHTATHAATHAATCTATH